MNLRSVVALVLILPWIPVSAQEPAWLVEARGREGKLVKPVTLKAKDGLFQMRVPAKPTSSKVEKDDEGNYLLAFDIGAQSPIECVVFPGGIDLASSLNATAQATFPMIAEAQGKIEVTSLENTDAGAIGGSPFMAANWLYRVSSQQGARLGALKQLTALKSGAGIYCVHIELGYAKTFRDVVSALVETFEFTTREATPYYSEIMLAELSGTRVGVAHLVMTRDEEGDSKIKNVTSIALPAGDGSMRAQDTVSVQFTRPDGSLINAVYVESVNGDLDAELNLQRDDRRWQVSGEFKGKPLTATLPEDAVPQSIVEHATQIRTFLVRNPAAGDSIVSTRWTPSADPSRLLSFTSTALKKREDGNFELRESMGGVTVNYVAEATTGSALTATVEIGPAKIGFRRLHVSGAIK